MFPLQEAGCGNWLVWNPLTNKWKKLPPYKVPVDLWMIPFLSIRGGVLCNGVIYFRSSRNTADFTVERVLLCYDIKSGQWHEEVSDRRCTRIFEWDTALRRWVGTGLEMPMKIKRKFDYSVSMSTALLEMVAGGDYLVVTGYARDRSFRTAVYNTAEKNWRCLSTPGSRRFSRSATCRLNGIVLFKPTLDWVPWSSES